MRFGNSADGRKQIGQRTIHLTAVWWINKTTYIGSLARLAPSAEGKHIVLVM